MTGKEAYQPHETEPRFFYGYTVVIVAFFIMVVSWGLYSVFGIFFNPLLTEFHWTRAITSGAFSLSMVLHGVLGVVMGGLNDRFGPRVVVTLCGVLLGLGYLLMSQVSALWQLYLFYGAIIGIGISGVWVPLLSTVARWFVRRRSLMTGIVVSGLGIGGFAAPPVLSRLIAAYDWRLSYIIQGSVIILSIVIAAQFLRRDPARMGLLPYGGDEGKQPGLESETEGLSLGEAVRTAQFWLLLIMFFCFGFCAFSVMVHIVPHAIELQISAVSAANILAALNGVSVLGNFVLGGIVGDRIGNRQIFVIGLALMSVGLFCLIFAREEMMLYLLASVIGLALGGMGTSESPLMARLFGLSSHGLIFGVVGLGFTAGSAVGPVVTGHIFDLTHSYQVAFQVCAALAAVGLILVATLRPTKKLGIKL